MNFFHCPIKISRGTRDVPLWLASAYISATRQETRGRDDPHYTESVMWFFLRSCCPNQRAGNADATCCGKAWNERTKRDAQLARTVELALPLT